MEITKNNFLKELKIKNEKALEFVIDNYSYILVGIINKNLFYLPDRKEECLNDCLLAIWENIDSYDEKQAKFTSWIGGIAKYKSLNYIRKYNKDLENIEIDENISQEDTNLDILIKKEFNKQILDLLSHLSEEDKKIFIEVYFKDKTAKEISQELDLKEEVIYNRLSRGRKKLKMVIGGKNNEWKRYI